MKIIFFGTSSFALPALEKLHKSEEYEVLAVITQPDKPAGRKKQPLPSPVKTWALDHGLQIHQPEKLQATSYKLQADIIVVASYGNLIPLEILNFPKLGALNIHPSLLPKYRGPSPIQTAILNGDKETGVTIMQMDEEMDHGPLLAQRRVKSYELRVKFKDLHDLLAEAGAELLIEILPKYTRGEIEPKPQEDAEATYTQIITKEDARIDWNRSAEEIDRKVRAFHVWPVAWSTINDLRFKVHRSKPVKSTGNKPAEINFSEGKLVIGCGEDSALEIKECQLEGGKKISAKDFMNGFRQFDGVVLK